MYNYKEQRHVVFTEECQPMFLSIRDKTDNLLKLAGAARMQEIISDQIGLNWDMMACVDRLVELGEIVEITSPNVPGQYRVFVKKYTS